MRYAHFQYCIISVLSSTFYPLELGTRNEMADRLVYYLHYTTVGVTFEHSLSRSKMVFDIFGRIGINNFSRLERLSSFSFLFLNFFYIIIDLGEWARSESTFFIYVCSQTQ